LVIRYAQEVLRGEVVDRSSYEVLVEAVDVFDIELAESACPLVASQVKLLAVHSILEDIHNKTGFHILETLVVHVLQLTHQAFRRNETEFTWGYAIEERGSLFSALASVAPELVEMTAEVDELSANGGELTKVSGLELLSVEEAAEFVRPELSGIEELIESSRLEVLAHEEISEVTSELVGPEGVYKQVRRKVARVEEVVEISVREVTGLTWCALESRPSVWARAKFRTSWSFKSGAAVKRGHSIKDEVSP